MAWRSTDTKQRLLEAMRAEFLQHGFENASLRRAAATVGIAAPSVYSHFAGKEEMFSALVNPVIEKVSETFHAVDADKQKLLKEHRPADRILDRGQVMRTVLDFVYDHLEDVRLLLFCAAGTKYEGILDQAARMEAEATCHSMENAGFSGFSADDRETVFLIMRHQYQTYAEAIRLGYAKERTWAYWQTVSDFYTRGWKRLLPLSDEEIQEAVRPDIHQIKGV